MKYHLFENDLDANYAIGNRIAVDTETMGLDIFNRDRLCAVQLSNGDDDAAIVHFTNTDYNAPNLKKVLSDPNIEKIYHYARFDIASIYLYLDVWATPAICTKIASFLARTFTNRHGLKDLCYDLLDIRLNKQKQTSYWGADSLSHEQCEYAAHDVLHLHAIYDKLEKMLAREGRLELYKKCCNFLPQVIELDMLGWNNINIFDHNIYE